MKRFAVSTITALCGILVAATAHASYFEKGFVEDPEWKTQEEVDATTEERLDARTTDDEDELHFNPVDEQKEEANDDAKPTVTNDGVPHATMADLDLPENAAITRAQFTAMLVRATSSQGTIDACYWDITSFWPPRFELLFRDVSVDHPYAPEICVAMRDGLVRGYGNDVFRPDAFITFADAAKMLARSHGLTPWADTAKSKNWFDQYVIALGKENAIPLWIESIDQRMKVIDAEEMLRRLSSGNTRMPSRDAGDMIAAWEKAHAPRPAVIRPAVRPPVTTNVPQKPSSSTGTASSSNAKSIMSVSAPKSSAQANVSAAATASNASASSRPKAWYEF
jgi:hypothetical protein